MKKFKIHYLFGLLFLMFAACSNESNPDNNTPDWSDRIKGKWSGTGFIGTDTIKILMIVDAEKNVISGTAEVAYNNEIHVDYVVKGAINDQEITLTLTDIRNNLNYTGSFLATNPGIIEGIMLQTRFGAMPVTFLRRFT